MEENTKEEKKVLKLKALMFARARELAGTSELELLVPEGSTTTDCLTKLATQFPSLDAIRDSVVLALNYGYVTDPVKVKDGDELAIIPPISGLRGTVKIYPIKGQVWAVYRDGNPEQGTVPGRVFKSNGGGSTYKYDLVEILN